MGVPAAYGGASCARCGRQVPVRPVTWSMQVTRRGRQWLCEDCTREHARAIEARLDEQWW